jgi:hypothetical protein
VEVRSGGRAVTLAYWPSTVARAERVLARHPLRVVRWWKAVVATTLDDRGPAGLTLELIAAGRRAILRDHRLRVGNPTGRSCQGGVTLGRQEEDEASWMRLNRRVSDAELVVPASTCETCDRQPAVFMLAEDAAQVEACPECAWVPIVFTIDIEPSELSVLSLLS